MALKVSVKHKKLDILQQDRNTFLRSFKLDIFLFFKSTKPTTQMPKFQTQAKLSSFSHSKLNPITIATQIQPKTKEAKVEPKAERERGERQL